MIAEHNTTREDPVSNVVFSAYRVDAADPDWYNTSMRNSPRGDRAMAVTQMQMETLEKQLIRTGQSYRDFLIAVEEFPQFRVEFIDGEIVITPAPVPYHQSISGNLYRVLDRHVYSRKLGQLFYAPVDVELAPQTRIVEPDIIFIAQDRVPDLVGEKRITGAPDLVIEILSPATARADRHVKLPLYAESGVAEYWIVDPDSKAVEVYTLDGETYRVAGIFVEGQRINAGRFAAAAIDADDIFER